MSLKNIDNAHQWVLELNIRIACVFLLRVNTSRISKASCDVANIMSYYTTGIAAGFDASLLLSTPMCSQLCLAVWCIGTVSMWSLLEIKQPLERVSDLLHPLSYRTQSFILECIWVGTGAHTRP